MSSALHVASATSQLLLVPAETIPTPRHTPRQGFVDSLGFTDRYVQAQALLSCLSFLASPAAGQGPKQAGRRSRVRQAATNYRLSCHVSSMTLTA